MSIFSAIGKVVGGVAKTALSAATHGVSDKVLSALKSTGKAKKAIVNATQTAATNQAKALVTKAQGQATDRANQALASVLKVKKPAAKKKRASKKATAVATSVTKKAKAAKAKVKKVKKASKRTAPKGGLDLKKMAAAWRSAGKPGTWINWVKTMQIKKA